MEYNRLIDQTMLKPQATSKDILKLIAQAEKYHFKTVCVNSSWVKFCKEKIKDPNLGITTVVGFPLGASITQVKVKEAKLAIEHGADEIDMVFNIGRFKERDREFVLNDIKRVKKAIGSKILKVIVETALLTDREIIEATEIVVLSGADFIKTSTGFSFRGAMPKDIKLMHQSAQGKIKIKAAGGVANIEDLKTMVELGAERIGTSSGHKLMEALGKE